MKKKILRGLDRELHEKFKEYGSQALEWKRKCILMLVEIDDARIWEKKGFSCIQVYAGRLAGLSRGLVSDGLRILRKTANMPHIREVIEKRGINIIRVIESQLTFENEEFWAQQAMKMSKNVLEKYVREIKKLDTFEHPGMLKNPENTHQQAIANFANVELQFADSGQNFASNGSAEHAENLQTIIMQLSPATLARIQKLKGKLSWEGIIAQLLDEREEQLNATKPKAVKTDSRYIPAAIKRYVIRRTNGNCAYSDCKYEYDELHHTDRFSLNKTHDPDTIQALCSPHHQLMHHSLVDYEECVAQQWRIRLTPDTANPKFTIDQKVQRMRAVVINPVQNTT